MMRVRTEESLDNTILWVSSSILLKTIEANNPITNYGKYIKADNVSLSM